MSFEASFATRPNSRLSGLRFQLARIFQPQLRVQLDARWQRCVPFLDVNFRSCDRIAFPVRSASARCGTLPDARTRAHSSSPPATGCPRSSGGFATTTTSTATTSAATATTTTDST